MVLWISIWSEIYFQLKVECVRGAAEFETIIFLNLKLENGFEQIYSYQPSSRFWLRSLPRLLGRSPRNIRHVTPSKVPIRAFHCPPAAHISPSTSIIIGCLFIYFKHLNMLDQGYPTLRNPRAAIQKKHISKPHPNKRTLIIL